MRTIQVTNKTRGTLVGDRVGVADNALTRLVGLLGKHRLDAGEGLLIKPCSGVHTIGMKFPIDVIGLDKDRKVARLWPNMVPFRLTSVHPHLRSVVELPSGRIAECGIQIGDVLAFD